MIRHANVGDTSRVVEMLADAHSVSVMARYVEFSPAMARDQFMRHLADSNSLCLVYAPSDTPHGIFVATASNHPSAPIRIGIEIVSWIEPDYRGRAWFKMKRIFEAWAKEKGCKITSLSSKSDERFANAIRRNGYEIVESHFVKVL